MYPRLPALLFAALFLGMAVHAQPALVQLDMDHATFRYDESTSLLETYLAFGAGTLPFEARAEGGYEATVHLTYTIRPSNTTDVAEAQVAAVFEDTLQYTFRIADSAEVNTSDYFVQLVRLAVPPGEFEVELEVQADEARNRPAVTLRGDLAVPDYAPSSRARLSNLTLASSIERTTDRAHPFYKNGLIVQANPTLLYGDAMRRVFYYAEAYDLDQAVTGADDYTLLAYVAAANEPQPLPGLQERTTRPLRPVDVLAGSFDVGALPSGSYFLRLALLNSANEALVEQSHKFFVYNPAIQAPVADDDALDYEAMLYAAMDSSEVEENLQHVQIIATSRERRELNQLGEMTDKQEWLADFWRKRDSSTGSAVNQARREFYDRLLFVNERYGSLQRPGFRTDRGRIVLKYGQPSFIDPHKELDTAPYEVWEYDNIPGEGRSTFIFADREGFGDFLLLHASVSGEPKNSDWQSMIRR